MTDNLTPSLLNNPVYYKKIPSSSWARKVEASGSAAGFDGVEFEKSFLAAATSLGLDYTEIEGGALWDIRPVGPHWDASVKDKNINIKIAYTDWMFQDNIVGRMLPWSEDSFKLWGPLLFGPDTMTYQGSRFSLRTPKELEKLPPGIAVPVDPRKLAEQEERLRRYLQGVMQLQDYLFMSPRSRAVQYQIVDAVKALYAAQSKTVVKRNKKGKEVSRSSAPIETLTKEKREEVAKRLEELNEIFCADGSFHSYKFPNNFKVRLVTTSDYVMLPERDKGSVAYGTPGLKYLEILVGGKAVARGKLFVDKLGISSFRFNSLGTQTVGTRGKGSVAWVAKEQAKKGKHAKVGFDGLSGGLTHRVKADLEYRPWLDKGQKGTYEKPEEKIYSRTQADLTGGDAKLGKSFSGLGLLMKREKWSETKVVKKVEKTIQRDEMQPAIVMHMGPSQSKIGFFGVEARNHEGLKVLPQGAPIREKIALKVVDADGVILRDPSIPRWVWINEAGVDDMGRNPWKMIESLLEAADLPTFFKPENLEARKKAYRAFAGTGKGSIATQLDDPKGYDTEVALRVGPDKSNILYQKRTIKPEEPKVKRVADIDVSASLRQRVEFLYGWLYDTMGAFGVGRKRGGQIWKGKEAEEGDDSVDLSDGEEEEKEEKPKKVKSAKIAQANVDQKANLEKKAQRGEGQQQIAIARNSFPGGFYFVTLKNPDVFSSGDLSPEARLKLMSSLLATGEMRYVRVPGDNIKIKIAVSEMEIPGAVVTDERGEPFITVRPGKGDKGAVISLYDPAKDRSLFALAQKSAGLSFGSERFGAGTELARAKMRAKDVFRLKSAGQFVRPMAQSFTNAQKRIGLALSGGVSQDFGLGSSFQSLPRANIAQHVGAMRTFFQNYVDLSEAIRSNAETAANIAVKSAINGRLLPDDSTELREIAKFFATLDTMYKDDVELLVTEMKNVEALYRKYVKELTANGIQFNFKGEGGDTFRELQRSYRLLWGVLNPKDAENFVVDKKNFGGTQHKDKTKEGALFSAMSKGILLLVDRFQRRLHTFTKVDELEDILSNYATAL